jgi:hypothetical protein
VKYPYIRAVHVDEAQQVLMFHNEPPIPGGMNLAEAFSYRPFYLLSQGRVT